MAVLLKRRHRKLMRGAYTFPLTFILSVALTCSAANAYEKGLGEKVYGIVTSDENKPEVIEPKYHCPNLYDPMGPTRGKIPQGKDGWFFRETTLLEDFESLDITAYYMSKLRKAFQDIGTDLMFFIVPPRPVIAANHLNFSQPVLNRYELDVARKTFMEYINGMNAQGGQVVTFDVNRPVDDFFYKRDLHWRPEGARTVAQYFGEKIKAMPFYKKLEPGTYHSEITGTASLKSEMGQQIDRACDGDIPAEDYPLYRTNKELGEGADALFGDSSNEGLIVLLGTSYTDGKYNFDGFMMEYTGMEVANYAISGGGLRNSIISYVTLPPEKRLKPDLIVWESLAHYDVNQAPYMFRQAIPAIYGECSEADALASGNVTIAGGEETLLFDKLNVDGVKGEDYFLFMQADNLAFIKMTMEFNHRDGDGEWFPIDRSWRYNNTGRFFFQLSDAMNAPLESVKVLHDASTNTGIHYRLCKQNQIKSAQENEKTTRNNT